MSQMDYQPGLKAILDNSATLVNWALAVMGGSIVVILGTAYERPKTWRGRLMYGFFPLAWPFLFCSVQAGERISQRFIAAQLDPAPENVRKVLMSMNADFSNQYNMLLFGLILMGAWLLCFLIWWVFSAPKKSEKEDSVRTVNKTSSVD